MSEENENELTQKEKFAVRYVCFSVTILALFGTWLLYLEHVLLEQWRAGQIQFLTYYVLKYEWTPTIVLVVNVLLIIVGILLACLSKRE